jgi:RNA polymerase sigma-70 factor, ECF subfamily
MGNSAAAAGAASPGNADSDARVVRRVRDGDREAYRLLVLRYQDGLYRYALRVTRSPDIAADLVQAAFVKAYVSLKSCRDPDRFAAWVFRILTNRCKDFLKSRRRRDVSLEPDQLPAPQRADPARDLDRAELRSALAAGLARLPAAQREAFLMKHVDGMSYEEIAERLGGSVPALKMRVHRARERLRSLLEEVV